MSLTFEDVGNLARILEANRYGYMSAEFGDLKIEVEREAPEKSTAQSALPVRPHITPATSSDGEKRADTQRVHSPAAGRIYWENGRNMVDSLQMRKDTVLGRIEAASTSVTIIAGSNGRVTHLGGFDDGDFVEYGQWLLTIQPES